MKNILITGGTSGMGKALAIYFLQKGNQVIVIGSSKKNGELFLEEVRKNGWDDRAFFVQGDLSSIKENKRVLKIVTNTCSKIDYVIFCAQSQKFSKKHRLTEEGFEFNFALYYLSRFMISYGLVEYMDKAEQPIILNICGTGGNRKIQWDDLELKNDTKFTSIKAILHGSRFNDLMAVTFVEKLNTKRIKYILFNPGAVQTQGAMEAFNHPFIKFMVKILYKGLGKPTTDAIKPMVELLENPPIDSLTAYSKRKQISINKTSYNKNDAEQLYKRTESMLRAFNSLN